MRFVVQKDLEMGNMWIKIILILALIKALITGCGGGGDRSATGSSEPITIVRPDPQEPTFFPPSLTQGAFDVSILPDDGSLIDEQQTLHFHLNRPGRIFYAFQSGDLIRTEELRPVVVEEKTHRNSFSIDIPDSISGQLLVRYFAVDENFNETNLRTARYNISKFSAIKPQAVGTPLVGNPVSTASGEVIAESRPIMGRTVLSPNIR